jgi:hypothetical protein
MLKATLYNKGTYARYFEAEVPVDNPKKVKELLLILKEKGVSIPKSKKDDKDFDWWG